MIFRFHNTVVSVSKITILEDFFTKVLHFILRRFQKMSVTDALKIGRKYGLYFNFIVFHVDDYG